MTSGVSCTEQLLGNARIYYYRQQRSCGQGNIFTPVCHSVHRGVSASEHAGIPPPWEQTSPSADTPLEQTPPKQTHPPEQTPPEQTPPWEQTLPGANTPQADTPRADMPPRVDNPPSRHPPLEQTHPPEQTPPPRRRPPGADTLQKADCGIRSISGWYASYWNAFLFYLSISLLTLFKNSRT